MLKSKDANDSQFVASVLIPKSSEPYNGILPSLTSTPVNSPVPRLRRTKINPSTISKQGTPRRYSLSDTNPSVGSNSGSLTHSPGPLLASLNFRDNVSLYEETKSSGLARRIVSYKEEAEQEKHLTHQEKYGSPGLFPVVHLFKKSPPEQPLKRVKVKLASPEYLRSYSPQQRSKVLEEITRPRLHRQLSLPPHSQLSDTGTKSVLDALKEISRKRIHSNEEYGYSEEVGKRAKTNLQNGTSSSATSKRGRADSPLLDQSDSPSSKQTKKKFCVYDEFAASRSSSDFTFLAKSEPMGAKRKTTCTSTESLYEPKHSKLVNVETQTIAAATTNEKTTETEIPQEKIKKLKKPDYPLKIFDDAPLQRIRKSRLAALMGTIMGKEIVIPLDTEPKAKQLEDSIKSIAKENEEKHRADAEKQNSESKKDEADGSLKSILNAPKSIDEEKTEKHVHFTLPITSSSSQLSSTQTSLSVVTPIISNSVKQSSIPLQVDAPVNTSAAFNTENTTAPVVSSSQPLPVFGFGSGSSVGNTTQETTSPTSSFTFSTADKGSPSKPGGFKFDLKSPETSKSNAPTINFPAISATNVMAATSTSAPSPSTFNLVKAQDSGKSAGFAFGVPAASKSDTKSEPVLQFGASSSAFTAKTTEAKSDTNVGGFGFGVATVAPVTNSSGFNVSTPQSAASPFGLGTVTSTVSTAKAQPSFGFVTSSAVISSASISAPQPSFSFGTAASTATSEVPSAFKPTFSFTPDTSTSTSTVQSSAQPTFGFSAAAASPFAPKTTAAFGTTVSSAQTTNAAFGSTAPTTTATPGFAFGSSQPSKPAGFGSAPAATTTSSLFSATVTTTSTPGFNSFGSAPAATTTSSLFSATVTTASTPGFSGFTAQTTSSSFGSSSFGASGAFKFSAPTTTASGFGTGTAGFGTVATTSQSTFGSTQPTFGLAPTTTVPSFGSGQSTFGSSVSTTNASTFGSLEVQPSAFRSNVFGSGTSAPAFGSGTFGATTTQASSLFGSSSATTSAPSFGGNSFGRSATTASTAPSMFGTNNTTPSFSFGSGNKAATNPFGAATTTASSSFASSTSFSSSGSFGGNGAFGNSAPAFGAPAPAPSGFGVTTAPSFGQTSNKPTFSFGGSEQKTTPGFGSGTGSSAFGPAVTGQNSGFGSTGTLGTATTNGFGAHNGGLTFGSSNTPSAAPFTFGSGANNNTEAPKPTFNFTGSANPPAFGAASNPPTFGAASSFSGGQAPSFPGMPQAAGVFTIGSGSSTGSRPRQPARARRRNV